MGIIFPYTYTYIYIYSPEYANSVLLQNSQKVWPFLKMSIGGRGVHAGTAIRGKTAMWRLESLPK